MPAPAVIPALIAYVKVVAVKTLVVGSRSSDTPSREPVRCPGQGHAGNWRGVDVDQTCFRSSPPGVTGSRSFAAVVRLGVPFTVTKLA